MHAWKKKIIFYSHFNVFVKGGNANNLIVIIVQALMQQRGLTQKKITKRLICFGADGASIFQGCRTRMTFQLKEKFVPYMMGQHCMAHRMNLVVQVLSNMPMVAKLENLLQSNFIFIFPIPLSAIWNSLSLSRLWKQKG
jgi:hypothetical protein